MTAFPDTGAAQERLEAVIDRVVPVEDRRDLRIAISRFAEARYQAGYDAGKLAYRPTFTRRPA